MLPNARPIAVAAAGVGSDEHLACVGVALIADLLPPRFDRGGREHRRVVVDPDADEAVVSRDVVHAIRNRLADGGAGKVVHIYQLGLALRLATRGRRS